MTNYNTHPSSVKDGNMIYFKHSAYPYLKVCTDSGHGYVVNLWNGRLLDIVKLEDYGLEPRCYDTGHPIRELY